MSNSEAIVTEQQPFNSVYDISFKFIGSFGTLTELENLETKHGDVALLKDGRTYVYCDEWIEIGCNSVTTAGTLSDYPFRDIKVSTCPHCSATLPLTRIDNAGVCTCEYCGSPVYVY